MTVTIAHLTDLHVLEGPRLQDQAEALSRAVDQIVACRPDLIALTGDTYGHAVPHRSSPAERLVVLRALERLAAVAPVVYVKGNHDHDDDVAGFAHVATGPEFPPIRVVDRPLPFTVRAGGRDVHVFPLPYFRRRAFLADRGDDVPPTADEVVVASNNAIRGLFASWRGRVERLRAKNPDAVAVFLAHVQIRGATLGSGEVLAGGEVEVDPGDVNDAGFDYAGIGHIHKRQRFGPSAWYVGSLWPTSHSRAAGQAFGWHLVTIGGTPEERDQNFQDAIPRSVMQIQRRDVLDWRDEGRTSVAFVTCRPRRLVTLDYRFGSTDDDPVPRFLVRPTAAELAAVDGAEVRPVLVVPAQFATSVPWPAELARLTEAGAVRFHPTESGDVVVEPVHRVRDGSEAVASAPDLEGQVAAYLATLDSKPNDADRSALFAFLRELRDDADDVIDNRTDGIASTS